MLNGYFSLVKLLLDKGANVHVLNGDPLVIAAFNGDFNMIKLLMTYGAGNLPEGHNAALAWAATNGHFDIVNYFIKHNIGDTDYAIQFLSGVEQASYTNDMIELLKKYK